MFFTCCWTEFDQDQEMVRDAVRAFAQEKLWPHAARWDKEHHFPKEATRAWPRWALRHLRARRIRRRGADYLTLALVLEEIAAGDGGTSTTISVTNCPVNAILMKYGNAGAKDQWLTPLAQGEMLGAFCLTEPHVGSTRRRCAPRR
jgi:butyryl-CoA dehydrogenase